MKIPFTFLAAALLFTLISCDGKEDKAHKVLLPVSVTFDYGSMATQKVRYVFSYEGRRLTNFRFYKEETLSSEYSIGYEEGVPVSWNILQDQWGNKSSITFDYSGQKVKATFPNPAAYSFILKIDDKGRILSYDKDGIQSTYRYDGRGNIETIYAGDDLAPSLALEYDNNPGLFSNVETPQWLIYFIYEYRELLSLSTVNNVKEYTHTNSNHYLYTYTYNEAGYPVEVKIGMPEWPEAEPDMVYITYTEAD